MDYRKTDAAVLGSTGSVGMQAIDALSALGTRITALCAGRNVRELAAQALKCGAGLVATPYEESGAELRELLSGSRVEVLSGADAVVQMIRRCGCPLIVHAISGMAGLAPALAAAETGARIAMANKEAIISAGHLIYERLKHSGGELIPVDSEHSAIFQCLCAQGAARTNSPADASSVRRIILTASGGPFFGFDAEALESVTPEMALAHPTWKMGPKITVDSATLMNKGFELLEACRLFGVAPGQVEVVVHRQSIIHSMVEYIDTSVIAQLSYPDMRDCVRFALSYPERVPAGSPPLDFAALGRLDFAAPDERLFPLLPLAREAWSIGGTAPAALIAADEEAVAAFLRREIGFTDIARVTAEAMRSTPPFDDRAPDGIYSAEGSARAIACEIIGRIKI